MEVSDWSPKQFAMEMIAHGQYGVTVAIKIMRDFEREWGPEDAAMRAKGEALMAYARRAPHSPTHSSPGNDPKWLREAYRVAEEAAEKAWQAAVDARDGGDAS